MKGEDEAPIIDRLLAMNDDSAFGRYEYDRANGLLSVRPSDPPSRRQWSVHVAEEDLQAYLAEYSRQDARDDPDEDLTPFAFTLFTVDVMENMDTGRDAFAGLREFLCERHPDD